MNCNVKSLLTVVIGLSILQACNDTAERQTENQVVQSSAELKDHAHEYSKARKDHVERRISENLEIIKSHLYNLEQETARHSGHLSSEARLRYEQLRQDLLRIEEDMEIRLGEVEHTLRKEYDSAEDNLTEGLEQTEDELEQVNEEIDEWFDLYID